MLKAGYICKKCGLDVFDVDVRDRAENEDVVNYVHHVNRICCENHGIRSPYCVPESLDLKVPISGNGIGFVGPELTEEEQENLRKE